MASWFLGGRLSHMGWVGENSLYLDFEAEQWKE